MKNITQFGKWAGLSGVIALVACSGSAVVDGPGGSSGGSGNDAGAPSTGGSAGASSGGVGGKGVGGSGVSGSGTGGSGTGGSGTGGSGTGGSGTGGNGVGGHAGSSDGGNGGNGGNAGKGGGSAGSGGACVNGATMMVDCNTCQCAGGQWACTAIACPIKACGGFIGSTCSATEYCAYTPGQACGAADASSNCQPRPDACSKIYMPVCGCDQITYSNTCDAAQHGQGVLADGACPART